MALIRPYRDTLPELHANVRLAENCTLVGQVTLEADVSVWYGAVLRGDVGTIRVGARSNLQDLVCVHLSRGYTNTVIGEEVTVGHGAIIHGVTVHDGALIGMGAVLLDRAVIGEEAMVAAGTVVPPRLEVPPRHLVVGNPGRVVRELRPDEIRQGRESALHYVELARESLGTS